ncbi:hypothetical protein TNCV_999071 [Trichonephila clavipes]|nr:hypothetical protein TNCV_999071 [Trichonephila clavipes]
MEEQWISAAFSDERHFCLAANGDPILKLDKPYALVVKKDIMSLPELVFTSFDLFGSGEVERFHCLL